MDQSIRVMKIFCVVALICQLGIAGYFCYKAYYGIGIAAAAASLFSLWSIGFLGKLKFKTKKVKNKDDWDLNVEIHY